MLHALIDIPVDEPSLQLLSKMEGVQVSLVAKPEERSRALPEALIKDCNVLFCTFPPENHEKMHHLKMIQIASSGYGQLTGLHFEDRNIRACNALGVFDVPIAEWNVAMMINLKRHIRQLMDNQQKRIWDRDARFQKEVHHATVGIWGYGGIGRQTARLAKSLGMNVRVLTRHGITSRQNIYCVPGTGDAEGVFADEIYFLKDKDQFLSGLDFLIMAVPLNKQTEGIIGEAELKLLGEKAFLLNPARGPLVKEEALIAALENKWIAGAALDTHYYYPMPAGHPLWRFDNVIMTPHISGSSANPEFLRRIWDIFLQNVMNFMSDKKLLNELTPGQLRGD